MRKTGFFRIRIDHFGVVIFRGILRFFKTLILLAIISALKTVPERRMLRVVLE